MCVCACMCLSLGVHTVQTYSLFPALHVYVTHSTCAHHLIFHVQYTTIQHNTCLVQHNADYIPHNCTVLCCTNGQNRQTIDTSTQTIGTTHGGKAQSRKVQSSPTVLRTILPVVVVDSPSYQSYRRRRPYSYCTWTRTCTLTHTTVTTLVST